MSLDHSGNCPALTSDSCFLYKFMHSSKLWIWNACHIFALSFFLSEIMWTFTVPCLSSLWTTQGWISTTASYEGHLYDICCRNASCILWLVLQQCAEKLLALNPLILCEMLHKFICTISSRGVTCSHLRGRNQFTNTKAPKLPLWVHLVLIYLKINQFRWS